jgi:hypothetical protein
VHDEKPMQSADFSAVHQEWNYLRNFMSRES